VNIDQINIVPIYEKVLELVVKEQIENHLQDNNIITPIILLLH